MDYELAVIVSFDSVILTSESRFREIRTAQIDNGLALIPVTDELLRELSLDAEMGLNKLIPAFPGEARARKLTPYLVSLLLELSGFSPVAYCEAAYENGSGEQFAVLWQAHKIICGPLCTKWGKFGDPLNKVKMEDLAINTVLRRMGVLKVKGKDEFDVVGLGRKRSTVAWC